MTPAGLRRDYLRWVDTTTPRPVVYVRTGRQSGWSPRQVWRAECDGAVIATGHTLAEAARDARAALRGAA